ncbi:Putative Structure-specific endonuclease subunit slx1 [Penicillium brasilianum]|uniref:Putative Structure-specific endonuclease subunit slx1 n=1 Tax=Penicillium brasilianum TaxID=104259 RepID=A0A0F7TWQ5_PENBI|nr:Putative Structure-specific endonuclease subunit slx1 [Penicillium brasilianum]
MDIQGQPKPIPAYYCCYLLRSTVRHASLYIGSTPNPIRRLPQHNGDAKGGAKRTSRDKLRPWEMVLVVEGFMSRVGALQFEWAWQHSEKSRHLLEDGAELDIQSQVAIGSKTGKAKPRASRSRRSLTAHLEDLHLLLRSVYFASWPLRVRFFRADVYRVWRIWNERVDVPLPDDKIILDGDCPGQGNKDLVVGSINGLSVDYTKLEIYLEKSMFLLGDAQDLQCKLCSAMMVPNTEQIVVCPHTHCRGAHHLLCLSKAFLKGTDDSDILIPTSGVCPACDNMVSWPLMMQELSLRNRAEKEVRTILRRKERRDRKGNATASSSNDKAGPIRQVSVEPSQHGSRDHGHPMTADDPLLDDDWYEEIDMESDTEHGAQKQRSTQPPSRLEIVIEDSDWDDAEIIE